MSHKSGFVNIIGSPNVGKSTLMNQLVGEKLSIITSKMQTTRHRIMGMVNEEDYQIVFSDVHSNIGPTSVVGCKEAEALATWLPQMSRSFEYAFNCIVSAAIDEVAANASDIRACAYSSNKLKKMRRLAIDGRSIDMAFEIFAKRHPCLFSCATTLC